MILHTKLTHNIGQFNFHKLVLILFISQFFIFSAYAAQISEQQMEQFKKLPPAQQEALAKSMGVDLNMIKGQLSAKGSEEPSKNTESYPRGTQFDALDNPVFDEFSQEEEDEFDLIQELKPFGYEVFANAPQTFAPTMDIAIPANYTVGPGDKISIQIFGKESDELELEVNREGDVVFPTHGAFSVGGLSFSEMKRLLIARIKEKVIGVDVVVGMAALRSMRVFVLGDAHKPGSYTLSSLSSITHAIFAAGGINDIGSLRNIQLKRAGKLVTTLDLYELLIQGDSSNDELLQSGDVVFISSVGNRVRVEGEVRRPAIYELIANDNFNNVLTMAGGLLPTAFAKSTIVERYNRHALRTVVNVDLTNEKDLAQRVHAGDAIRIMKAAEMFSQSITLIGAMTRPGKYQWQQGQRITDLFPSIKSHLLPSADLNYGLVVREIDVAGNIEVLQFDFVQAISDVNSDDNLLLQSNDKILVFSRDAKLEGASIELDMLAYTEEELANKEQEIAKATHKSKRFWQKFGDEDQLAQFMNQEDKDAEATAKLVNKAIEQMSGGTVEEEIDIKDYALFSRQRLLLPIIEKLNRQGKSGKPIQLIEIDGAVKYPGTYPLAINGRVDDLVSAAGGLTESAYLVRADITRNQVVTNIARKKFISVNLDLALKSEEGENVLLQAKDRLNIHQIPAWSENNFVELRGEFVFPGKYTVRRGESLADLIAKAGGFTEFAHREGSVFTRVQLRELEQQNLLKLTADLRVEMASKSMTDKNYSQSYADVQQMLSDMASVQPVGRLVIDLPKVIGDKNYDVLLEGGDVLYVPTHKNSINVIGQVQVTSSHMFDISLSAEDYLDKSGGSKKRADTGRIYIIAANGSIKMMDTGNWFGSNAGDNIKPGDTIVVPLDAEYMNNLELWTNVTGIIYNSAVAIASISNINK